MFLYFWEMEISGSYISYMFPYISRNGNPQTDNLKTSYISGSNFSSSKIKQILIF